MQDFRYCLWTSILDGFGQLVSTTCVLSYIMGLSYSVGYVSVFPGKYAHYIVGLIVSTLL